MSFARTRLVRCNPKMVALRILIGRIVGTLTKNEQTVVEAYTVDETVKVDSSAPPSHVSPALRKALQIGCLCNNAFRNEEGEYIGQATDVALLNVLNTFWMTDNRDVCM